jgi:hypothetical protein
VKQLERSLREAGAMLVAYRPAGLSALEAHYAGLNARTSGFDGRDHGNPSDVQMTRASAAALRDRMGGSILAARLDPLAASLEAGA